MDDVRIGKHISQESESRHDCGGAEIIRRDVHHGHRYGVAALRRGSETCIVWLEFASRARPIDHYGEYGATVGERRELVEGPLFDDSTPDQHGDNIAKSFLADLHWVARGTNDALRLLRADVDLDDNGACVAGTQVQFTPNLAYRDVFDRKRLTTYGEARLAASPAPIRPLPCSSNSPRRALRSRSTRARQ